MKYKATNKHRGKGDRYKAADKERPGSTNKNINITKKSSVDLNKNIKIKKNAKGKAVAIIDRSDEPGKDVEAIIDSYSLPVSFGEKALLQAEVAAREVTGSNPGNRRDLRNLTMYTIDGADAKDLDDAVSLEKEDENYRLGVHIADVAGFVRENSALDREARRRGTSTYLADRVIPMLPEVLSNGVCSLNTGCDRLTVSCLMLVSPNGEVLEYEIAETLINVDKRLTYDMVTAMLAKRDETDNKAAADTHCESTANNGGLSSATDIEDSALLTTILMMERLAIILRKKRKKRGAIDFEFPECVMELDDAGVPVEISAKWPTNATRIIEEFMLLANETVAAHFNQLKVPFIYRTHDDPDPQKIEELRVSLDGFSNKANGVKPTSKREKEKRKRRRPLKRESGIVKRIRPRDVQEILRKAAGTPYEATVNLMTLRSMKRAEYTCVRGKTSHFGLASPCYCHFTSPIRRYPDLQIQRIIKEHLHGKLSQGRKEHYLSILGEVAQNSSARERRAEEAEREVEKMKKAHYMESRVGSVYDGVISGITKWGIYVELENTIEGLVHITNLGNDYYYFDEGACRLVGRRSGSMFCLGQSVRIWVKNADKWRQIIDFELAN
ncbi:MAG: VacB/RNase II family 3'-5' exoribonuclease [Lachnospiraceae bacterium]|nr:VacB/RNase II family 3'-5' exoribonuclease [Lachnospiraceae bacterium]